MSRAITVNRMNYYSVRYQLVDMPANESRSAESVSDDGLVTEFRKFPYASELKRAEKLKGDITLPTLTFKRESDGEEIGIWTEDAARFDLCLIRDSKKKFLRSRTAPEVEDVLEQFKTKSVLEIEAKGMTAPAASGASPPDAAAQGIVFYDSQGRWVAILNMAFVVGGIYFAVRYVEGFGKYVVIVFLGLFSLIWIKACLFGFGVRLASDGRLLNWREGSKKGSVELKNIAAISIDTPRPAMRRGPDMTLVTLKLTDGRDMELPPNLGTGLRLENWRQLRELAAHVRLFSPALEVDAGNSDFKSKA